MERAAALLKQSLQLLKNNRDLGTEQAAQDLMQKSQSALAQSLEFQALLTEKVPKQWQTIVCQRVTRQLYRCPDPDRLAIWTEQRITRTVSSLRIDEDLCVLIQQIQALPRDSSQRRNLIPVLITQMQASGKITTCIPNLPPELYYDALHETWLWFCDHIDEYDSARSAPVVWFNRNLFYTASKIKRSHFRDLPNKLQEGRKEKRDQGGPDPYNSLIVEAEHQILEDLYDWVQQDNKGHLKRTALRDRPDINVQVIVKAVLDHIRTLHSLSESHTHLYDLYSSQPTDLAQLFAQIAVQLGCSSKRLKRFWREKCRPCIGDFLQESGNG